MTEYGLVEVDLNSGYKIIGEALGADGRGNVRVEDSVTGEAHWFPDYMVNPLDD